MKKSKSPMLSTRGGCTAQPYDNSSITVSHEPFNHELELVADDEFIDQQLRSCPNPASRRREIIRLFTAGLLPPAIAQKLLANLRGCRS